MEQLTFNNKKLFRLAFEGTNFYGTQVQTGFVTISNKLEEVKNMLKIDGNFKFFSRLDSGVHAKDFPVLLKLKKSFNGNLLHAFNSQLPQEIRIQKIQNIQTDFENSIITSKVYRYYVYKSISDNPLINRFATRIDPKIDLEKSHHVLNLFEGQHDFKNFRTTGSNVKTTIRKIDKFQLLKKTQNLYFFQIQGPGFLKNQVRMMVGCVLQFCENKIDESQIQSLLMGKIDRSPWMAKMMDARGLMLYRVRVNKDILLK